MYDAPIPRFRQNAGFSLIDVMVVLLFSGLILAGAIPLFASFTTGMRLGQGAHDVEAELQTARLKAVTTNRPVRVRFNCPAAGSYRMVELIGTTSTPAAADDASDRCTTASYPYPPADRNPLTLPNNDGPVRALPSGVSFGTTSTLEFWADGSVHKQSASENPWNVVAPTGTTITLTTTTSLTQSSESKIISVNGLGKIRLEQP